MPQPNPVGARSDDRSSRGAGSGGIRAWFASSGWGTRLRVAVYSLPVVLVALYFAVDLLGGACSGDLLDDPDYGCNTGGDAMWPIFFLGLISPVVVGAMLLFDLATYVVRRSRRGRGQHR
jgi:hypothetical protein